MEELSSTSTVREKGHAAPGTIWPLNRRTTSALCRHCGKEFVTDKPWRKNCGWKCTYDRMQELKRARRAKAKTLAKGKFTCVVCRELKDELAKPHPTKPTKGVCYGCATAIEELGYDYAKACRMAYAIRMLY